jgi:hypothetical protein
MTTPEYEEYYKNINNNIDIIDKFIKSNNTMISSQLKLLEAVNKKLEGLTKEKEQLELQLKNKNNSQMETDRLKEMIKSINSKLEEIKNRLMDQNDDAGYTKLNKALNDTINSINNNINKSGNNGNTNTLAQMVFGSTTPTQGPPPTQVPRPPGYNTGMFGRAFGPSFGTTLPPPPPVNQTKGGYIYNKTPQNKRKYKKGGKSSKRKTNKRLK